MDLKRLGHLVSLADCQNFRKASDQCHLSQSAFSRSIQAAEDELGMQLFDRGTTEVRCTPAGDFIVERARKLLFENRCLERDVNLYRERLIGDLAIGAGPYPAATILPDLLSDLRSRFTGVKVRVTVNSAAYLLQQLRAEKLDFFLADVANIAPSPELDINPIGFMEAGFYVRTGHPLLNTATVDVAALLPYGLASVQLHEKATTLLAELMGMPAGSAFPLALEADDLALLKTVTMKTDTVLGCPIAGAVDEVANQELVRLTVNHWTPIGSHVGMISLKGRSLSPMAQYATAFLAKRAG